MAIVALRDAGVPGLEIAEIFKLSPEQVSRLRSRVKQNGSAGLAPLRGRPPKLSERNISTVRRLAADGVTQTEIAKRFSVARSVIGEILSKRGLAPEQAVLEESAGEAPTDGPAADNTAPPEPESAPAPVAPLDTTPVDTTPVADGPVPFVGLARIATGEHPSRYAGAALLYPFFDMVGAAEIFSTLTGGPARRFDDLSVLATALMGFALGTDTIEGTKHLRRVDAGALVGVSAIPELGTLRDRLCALADGSDPLALQRGFATRMLASDPPTSPVYYVDDHFVAYAGAKPVAKGWNTKRRHAQPGRDDTVVSDDRGRAVVFASGEPSGLASTMGSVLGQLREVAGAGQRILLGFDRGGSFPVAFKACREAGMDWITYKRGKLVSVGAPVKRSWCERAGTRTVVHVADEVVDIKGYGKARQLTLFERGAAVLQVLTSDMDANGAALICWLRHRWSLENLFKYAEAHNGIDSIASYAMDIVSDDRIVANPERKLARTAFDAAEAALADSERALAQMLCDPEVPVEDKNARSSDLKRAVEQGEESVARARQALKGIPAKVKATDLDPEAVWAKMRLERRGLQMVCRLLAFNAEVWVAEHFNAYLEDPDEYRAILRHLLHLGGSFSYERDSITVTLDRPDSPRVARALEFLAQELTACSASLIGDRRLICYRVAAGRQN
jgi:hypothetical protein